MFVPIAVREEERDFLRRYLIAVLRFVNETLRGDNVFYANLTPAQWICILLTVVMAAGAVCIGAVRGWTGERDAALGVFSESGSLGSELQNRAMDAANLAVVASRHLSGDADVALLRSAHKTITDGVNNRARRWPNPLKPINIVSTPESATIWMRLLFLWL